MSQSELNKAKEELIENLNESLELIKQINKSNILTKEQIFSIYELSFLKMYLSWESFIGRIFILYMIGENTDSGYSPKRYVLPKDEQHAYDIVKGRQKFVDWSNLELLFQWANLYFENGTPFRDILIKSNINSELKNMRILRNKIVHSSKESDANFIKLIRDEFGFASDISPGEFLYRERVKNEKPPKTYIEYYKKILEVACNELVR